MAAPDVNALFARAEAAFRSGRHEAARADLIAIERAGVAHPAVLHLQGLVEKALGDLQASRHSLERAHRLAPNDAQIANNLANLLDQMGDRDAALDAYGAALAANPAFAEARLNRAIVLHNAARYDAARSDFAIVLKAAPGIARAWSAAGAMERDAGDLDAAASAFDRALAIKPDQAVALHGRARIALERGEEDAPARYTAAARAMPDDGEIAMGEAEAREAAGDPDATSRLAALVARRPDWAEGQALLARMRWEAGDHVHFADALRDAVAARPADAALRRALVATYAGADHFAKAAAAAGGSVDPEFVLLDAIHAGEGGDDQRAEAAFARLPAQHPGRALHEARHRIRLGAVEHAARLLDQARADAPDSVGAWALSGVVWRLLDDDRAAWLHDQPGLHRVTALDLDPTEIETIASLLRTLHRTRAFPIGQSLRGGTQTRGSLFARREPLIERLRASIECAVAAHWDALPPRDERHPLLRHRDHRPAIVGSWSVRLTDGGFHVAHTHSNGLLSSACYFVVPPPADGDANAGWLELGRPPADLRCTLAPVAMIEPAPGRLALFPSTLHHGTRPFAAGERITAAFDVAAR